MISDHSSVHFGLVRWAFYQMNAFRFGDVLGIISDDKNSVKFSGHVSRMSPTLTCDQKSADVFHLKALFMAASSESEFSFFHSSPNYGSSWNVTVYLRKWVPDRSWQLCKELSRCKLISLPEDTYMVFEHALPLPPIFSITCVYRGWKCAARSHFNILVLYSRKKHQVPTLKWRA